jgi:hypothetical protein
MQQREISSEKQPAGGIEATVKLYVQLGNLFALSEQKVHRLKLMSQHNDTADFSFRLLLDHCQKDIAAIDAGIRELLKRAPCRGYVEVCGPEKIAGWAQYVRYPEIPVTLGIYFDQKLAAQIVADRYRADLKEANLGSGQHSFEFVGSKELFLRSELIEVKAPNGSVIPKIKNQTVRSSS